MHVGETVQDTWTKSYSLQTSTARKKKWKTLFTGTCWGIWKQRNLKVFEDRVVPADHVIAWIVREATLWERF